MWLLFAYIVPLLWYITAALFLPISISWWLHLPVLGAFYYVMCFGPRPKALSFDWLGRILAFWLFWKTDDPRGYYSGSRHKEQYIFAIHGHSLYCLSEMLPFVLHTRPPTGRCKTRRAVPLVSDALAGVPLIGHIAVAQGCQSVGRDNFLSNLAVGRSVAMAPGGVREVLFAAKSTGEELHIIRNTEFLRIAFKRSVSVVPVVSIDEYKCWHFYSVPPRLRKFQQYCIGMFGWPLPMLASGWHGSFWPKSTHLTTRFCEARNPEDYNTEEDFIEAYYSGLSAELLSEYNCKLVMHKRKAK